MSLCFVSILSPMAAEMTFEDAQIRTVHARQAMEDKKKELEMKIDEQKNEIIQKKEEIEVKVEEKKDEVNVDKK